MAKIENVTAREVLDSRGNPTIEATISVTGGFSGTATVPSGASTGRHAAHELRDGDEGRYGGKGVLNAIKNIEGEIRAAIFKKDTANQSKIDHRLIALDGTPNKSRLGGNAILATSLACARAEAAAQGLPLYLYLQQLFPDRELVLPVPQFNIINGGAHASNGLSIQEFQVIPVGSPNFAEAVRLGSEVYRALEELFTKDGLQTEVGDEGGFAPKLDSSVHALTYLVRAIEAAGYVPGVDAFIGVDAAASQFLNEADGMYTLDGNVLGSNDLAYTYRTWHEDFPLISIEDPFGEDSWDEWSRLVKNNGHALQVVGDDLYVTNPTRVERGIKEQATNAVLIKPNQIGTLTETLRTILVAQEAKQQVVISHRSGDTEDTFIADLAVAVGAGQIKTGAPARSERTSKYNRLLHIAEKTEGPLAKVLQPFLQHNQPKHAESQLAA